MFTTFLVNIAIMSAAGTAATVGATFIPIMIRGRDPALQAERSSGYRRRDNDGLTSEPRLCSRYLHRQTRQHSGNGIHLQ